MQQYFLLTDFKYTENFLNFKINNMRVSFLSQISFLLLLLPVLSGCEAIGGVFKAGVWSGVFVVIIFVALLIYLVSRFTKK